MQSRHRWVQHHRCNISQAPKLLIPCRARHRTASHPRTTSMTARIDTVIDPFIHTVEVYPTATVASGGVR